MDFNQRVYKQVRRIPKGRVAAYGQIAALAGSPRAARQVGTALRALSGGELESIPWQRVINARGMISIENMQTPKQEQAERLQSEGVEVKFVDGNYWVDLDKYLWKIPNYK
jgi:methylated-DNA-protein-cysteine methyltransferase-like protein